MNVFVGVGDWDGDGYVDFVVCNISGVFYLYCGVGGYCFVFNVVVGLGW